MSLHERAEAKSENMAAAVVLYTEALSRAKTFLLHAPSLEPKERAELLLDLDDTTCLIHALKAVAMDEGFWASPDTADRVRQSLPLTAHPDVLTALQSQQHIGSLVHHLASHVERRVQDEQETEEEEAGQDAETEAEGGKDALCGCPTCVDVAGAPDRWQVWTPATEQERAAHALVSQFDLRYE